MCHGFPLGSYHFSNLCWSYYVVFLTYSITRIISKGRWIFENHVCWRSKYKKRLSFGPRRRGLIFCTFLSFVIIIRNFDKKRKAWIIERTVKLFVNLILKSNDWGDKLFRAMAYKSETLHLLSLFSAFLYVEGRYVSQNYGKRWTKRHPYSWGRGKTF